MAESVFLLGKIKPLVILCDRYGFTQGVKGPISYMLRVGAAAEGTDTLTSAGLFAYESLRSDRRLKKKKCGVVVWSVVLGEEVRVTPVYVRHKRCAKSEFSAEALRAAWEKLLALPELSEHTVRYYEREGEFYVDESSDAGSEFSAIRARGGPGFAAPTFAAVVELVVSPAKK